ncbi:MAG: azurin [Cyclobacteriaceae bacterium]|nr:azurin [Cyclobacteriaceae bacterium]MCH8515267.1 azurin [Cyclobacteriaceae bacterium]
MSIVKWSLSALVTISLFACGGGSESGGEKSENRSSQSSVPQQPTREEIMKNKKDYEEAADGTLLIRLESNDKMRYNKDKIKVPAGSEIKLTLVHTGEMPKKTMGHNFVLLQQGVDVRDFGEAAASAMDNDYIPSDADDQIIAHTSMIGGGEETEVTFSAPEAGEYDFICSFPGHVALMKGKFIVE